MGGENTTTIFNFSLVNSILNFSLLCWGFNDLGRQEVPCVFTILPAGKKLTIRTTKIIMTQAKIRDECLKLANISNILNLTG